MVYEVVERAEVRAVSPSAVSGSGGGQVVRARLPMHGKVSTVFHDGKGVFAGVPNPIEATRYHSLVVDRQSVPDCLEISAKTWDDEIMGLRHREYPCEGVQFHPESILTPQGKDLLRNFLQLCRRRRGRGGAPPRRRYCALILLREPRFEIEGFLPPAPGL